MHKLAIVLVLLALIACDKAPTETKVSMSSNESAAGEAAADRLAAVLAAQTVEFSARYQYRNPLETLVFVGVNRLR